MMAHNDKSIDDGGDSLINETLQKLYNADSDLRLDWFEGSLINRLHDALLQPPSSSSIQDDNLQHDIQRFCATQHSKSSFL